MITMIIVDVSLNVLRKIRTDTSSRFFHIDYPQAVEVYCVMNNMLFRYTKPKEGGEKDMLFFSDELKDSVPVHGISNVNEELWQRWANDVAGSLKDIIDVLKIQEKRSKL